MKNPLRNDWLGKVLERLPTHKRRILANEAKKVTNNEHWTTRVLSKKRYLAADGVSYV